MDGYDYIVVGAGSAGCVLARRLSDDPTCRVLLIEAGGSDRSALCRKPGMVSIIHTVPQVKARYDWGYKSAPRTATLDRRIPQVRGKVLGGCSAINGMVFVRGNRRNYDGWAAEGCEGWSADDVLPHFRRLEDWEGGADAWRGGGGPIPVTRATDVSPVSDALIASIAETTDTDVLEDYNGPIQEGAARMQLSHRDGVRSSTSEGYLHPVAHRLNLDVWERSQVTRVLLEGDRAVGVEVAEGGRLRAVRASQEVILSAGVFGSAQLLMLSGIGPAEHLAEHGLDVVADLPVGENLHDHLFFPLVYLAPRGGHRGTATHFFGGMIHDALIGGGWFSRSVFEAVAFVRTGLPSDAPDLQIHGLPWAYPAPNQDAPVRPVVDLRPAITVLPTLIYPESRGVVRLLSADPTDAPHIDPAYLEAESDVRTLMRGIELCREIMATGPVASELTAELEPGPDFSAPDALRAELPNRVCTVYHPVGTCRMGVDERAVVDPQLRVRGIRNLRVADAAIMPSISGGNTNAPSIMIGEKCAALLGAAP